MELIRISDCKLKIMLTPSDMRRFELNAENFGDDGTQMHRSFRLLMEEIREKTGFEAQDNRISVQYFPSREGGCEMFISNLQKEEGEKGSIARQYLPRLRSGTVPRRTVTVPSDLFRKDCAYRFERLSDLLPACRRLLGSKYIESSTAYKGENGRFYLLLTLLCHSALSLPEELQMIGEYGKAENPAVLSLYLSEHGSVICNGGAVERLASLA